MNREIKFRAWLKQSKQMVEVSDIHFDTGLLEAKAPKGTELHLINKLGYTSFPFGEHANNLMQFTGLIDKNGKEIYEGDIVGKQGEKGYEVVFKEGHFAIKDDMSKKIGDCPIIYGLQVGYEVIGDIYSTPDLLNK